MESNLIKFPRLKGSTNYEIWSIRMEAAITDKGYYDVMTPIDLNELATEEIANRTQRSYKAAALIRLSLEDGPLIQIRGINDSMAL